MSDSIMKLSIAIAAGRNLAIFSLNILHYFAISDNKKIGIPAHPPKARMGVFRNFRILNETKSKNMGIFRNLYTLFLTHL